MSAIYALDTTGTAPANLITNETQTITAANYQDFSFLIPQQAPFFGNSLRLTYTNANGVSINLSEGIDYILAVPFISASRACATPIYGGVSFLNLNLNGTITFNKYQSLGGSYTLDLPTLTELMVNMIYNPRIVSWEEITSLPDNFPPAPHAWDLLDMVGMEEVNQALGRIHDAILQSINNGQNAHFNDYNNPHQTTKAQVGLDLVQNYPVATVTQAIDGTDPSAYMTPLTTAAAIATGNGFGATKQMLTSLSNKIAASLSTTTDRIVALSTNNAQLVTDLGNSLGSVIANNVSTLSTSITSLSASTNTGDMSLSTAISALSTSTTAAGSSLSTSIVNLGNANGATAANINAAITSISTANSTASTNTAQFVQNIINSLSTSIASANTATANLSTAESTLSNTVAGISTGTISLSTAVLSLSTTASTNTAASAAAVTSLSTKVSSVAAAGDTSSLSTAVISLSTKISTAGTGTTTSTDTTSLSTAVISLSTVGSGLNASVTSLSTGANSLSTNLSTNNGSLSTAVVSLSTVDTSLSTAVISLSTKIGSGGGTASTSTNTGNVTLSSPVALFTNKLLYSSGALVSLSVNVSNSAPGYTWNESFSTPPSPTSPSSITQLDDFILKINQFTGNIAAVAADAHSTAELARGETGSIATWLAKIFNKTGFGGAPYFTVPGGLIFTINSLTTTAGVVSNPFSFPLTFPNGIVGSWVQIWNVSSDARAASIDGPTSRSGNNVTIINGANNNPATSVGILTIGY